MIDVVDFFCGCGGTSAGLKKAGMNILAGIDFDKDAGTTFKKNFYNSKFILQDIRILFPYDLHEIISRDRRRPLLFSACAPCQPFTQQKTAKKEKDERVVLLDEFHRFVKAFRPDYLFIENVPGLQKIQRDQGPLGRFTRLISELGYSYDLKVLSSQDYGVPQVRKRLVLIASCMGRIELPDTTHGPGKERYQTVEDWIADLPPLAAGQNDENTANHRAAALSELNLKRISCTPLGGGRNDWPNELKLDCHKDHTGHTDVYGRLHWKKPASALSTRCISLSNGRYGHPEQNRAISVREAARLQTFDDEFEFAGSLNSMARQIGNAVPVELARAFGNHLINHYEKLPTNDTAFTDGKI